MMFYPIIMLKINPWFHHENLYYFILPIEIEDPKKFNAIPLNFWFPHWDQANSMGKPYYTSMEKEKLIVTAEILMKKLSLNGSCKRFLNSIMLYCIITRGEIVFINGFELSYGQDEYIQEYQWNGYKIATHHDQKYDEIKLQRLYNSLNSKEEIEDMFYYIEVGRLLMSH